MIEEIRKIAEESHRRNYFGHHVTAVTKNALMLAKKLDADLEVVEIAACLHDIGLTQKKKIEKENEHHTLGAEKANEILKELGYDKAIIKKVEHCILTHRGRKGPDPKSLEAKIVACADAMAHFDTFLDLFSFFLEGSSSFEEAFADIEKKIERDWNKKLILPEAKEIVKPKYEAIKLLIKSMKEYV